MTMYQWLGAISIALLVVVFILMGMVFIGRSSLKKVYWISGTALTLLIAICILVSIIYIEFVF